MQASQSAGAMASIAAGRTEIEKLINGDRVFIAGLNSPLQTVISGEPEAVDVIVKRALARNLRVTMLPVSRAFHSPFVASSVDVFANYLASVSLKPLRRGVISTVTGQRLAPSANLIELLSSQITSPVLFMKAVSEAAVEELDLWLEVGPGRVLGGWSADIADTPVIFARCRRLLAARIAKRSRRGFLPGTVNQSSGSF